jgi:hypothetical protein
MTTLETLYKIVEIIRPQCNPFPFDIPFPNINPASKPLDEAFRLLIGLILKESVTERIKDYKTPSGPVPGDKDYVEVLHGSPKSSSSQVEDDNDNLIR